MAIEIPLGKKEDLRLEFKSRDALNKLETIGREVVAMLNAEGGEVWIGLRDEEDRAVAVESIAEPEVQRRRLRDHLIDTIEPPPSDEVAVDVIREEVGAVLRITTRPRPERGPYAYLKEGGRHFLVRTEDRTRPMTRPEIFSAPSSEKEAESKLDQGIDELFEELSTLQRRGETLLWLRLKPLRKLRLRPDRYQEHLVDPALTKNRRQGSNFTSTEYPPAVSPDKLVTSPDELRRVEIRRDGSMIFSVPLTALLRPGKEKELWPWSLWEYPISALRLASAVYREHLREDDRILADLALLGIKNWVLRPKSPSGAAAFSLFNPKIYDRDDFVSDRPLIFNAQETLEQPDLCGYRLLVRVYEGFGFTEEAVPQELDRETGRLILPE